MKLGTFFEKFDELADTPDGVKSMRELVLRLAFSGGLTGKRPTEDGVPDGWESRTIESISSSITPGFACSRSHQVENGHVHLRTHNISTLGTLNFDLLVRIDPKMVDPQKASVRAGDILFNNTNSQELVGKTSLVDRDYDFGFSNHITRIRLKDGIFPGFVVFYLTMLRNSGYFARLCTRWINQAAVNTDTLKEQTIPLPPLAEQKRIVAKVDELMVLCDRLEAQQQEREQKHAALARASLARFADAPTPSNLHFLFHPSYAIPPADLRKSILTLAVQGKLVPQDPNDEPAEELIERVSAALPNKKAENPFLGPIDASITDETEYELPHGWAWLPLGHVGVWATGCGFPTQHQGEPDNEFLFCKVSDMNLPGNEVEIRTTVHTIDAEVMKKIRARANPVGTVIFPKIGGAIATHKRRLVIKPTIIDNNCSGIQPIGLTHHRWLLLFLRNLDLTKYQSGTSVPAVSQGALDPIRIGLPPLAEQKRIVAKVDELMALVDDLEAQLAASRAAGEKLLAALVAELTAGKESHAAA